MIGRLLCYWGRHSTRKDINYETHVVKIKCLRPHCTFLVITQLPEDQWR